MNIGELFSERDRLLSILEEAKSAKSRLKQLNILITMYGEDEKVPLAKNVLPITSKPPCLVKDCDKPQKTRGLCSGHYQHHAKRKEGWEELDKLLLPPKTTGKVTSAPSSSSRKTADGRKF